MAFDIISFIVGVAAGALTGSLAGILYSLERTADLQEQLRRIKREVGDVRTLLSASDHPRKSRLDELDRDLEEIHEEIRRMYKRTTR
jgi:predicted acylesterase/phospholipase RssA